MAFTVTIDLGYEFTVKSPIGKVFDVLADVPKSASFFPKVDQLVDMGDNTYRWEMEKIGIASVHLQTIYAAKYEANKAKGTITWVPVKGVGNALVQGKWQLTDNKKSTSIVFSTKGDLSLPLPALTKMVVAPVVEAEFTKMVEQYIDNLIKHFGGEA
jgi:carbon monoxide dehydrogenase subunit G